MQPDEFLETQGGEVPNEAGRGAEDLTPLAADRPLAGLLVLELAHIIAGPTAGQILADLGANVIKVESVDGGDQSRATNKGVSGVFEFLNRNKRSVALDLKSGGRDVFLDLAGKADIILDNFAFGALDRLGVGYSVVSERNPRVIWLSIKGFLPGPLQARPLLDELAQMMSGLAYMTGPKGQPLRAGSSIVDSGAATFGVVGVLAALRQRDRTGHGQFITAGLFETSVYWVGQWMAIAQAMGEPSTPMPEMQQGIRMGWGVYQLFTTNDDEQIFIGVTSNRHWAAFCAALDAQDLFEDQRFKDNQGRVEHRGELTKTIEARVSQMSSGKLQEVLGKHRVPFAPLRRPDELIEDRHLKASGQLLEVPIDGPRTLLVPKLPFRAQGIDSPLRRPAPSLGQDTRNVLLDMGYAKERIRDLEISGAILCPVDCQQEADP